MPAPIVLATLDPETKRVPNPPPGEPVIATDVRFRDGSRSDSVTPVDPATPPVTYEPINPLVPSDWEARLARTGPGTVDTAFDAASALSFVGAFKLPYFSNSVSNTRIKEAIAYNPPNGSNGPNGSMFIGGEGGIAEVQIPGLSSATVSAELPPTTVLQNWVDVYSKFPIALTGGGSGKRIGWLRVINGKLYGTVYGYYSAGAPENLFIIDNPADLANSAYQGLMELQGQDSALGYLCDVPVDRQAEFGGSPYLTGMAMTLSMNGRTSFGHSLYGVDLESIATTDTFIPTTAYTFYPLASPIEGFDLTNTPIKEYYTAHLGVGIAEHCALPDDQRFPKTFDEIPLPDESIRGHILGNSSRTAVGLVVPGTDSIMFIGSNSGMRYGTGYKNYYIEDGPDGFQGGGYLPYSKYDRDNVFWTMNINDITAATSVSDVTYSSFGIFDSNRWRTNGNGAIMGGVFDPATSLIYLLQAGAAPFNAYESSFVVSVYHLGGV